MLLSRFKPNIPRDTPSLPLHANPTSISQEYVRLANIVMSANSHTGKIRLTGGEPTLHPTLVSLVGRLRDVTSGTVGITSNGVVLHRNIKGEFEVAERGGERS